MATVCTFVQTEMALEPNHRHSGLGLGFPGYAAQHHSPSGPLRPVGDELDVACHSPKRRGAYHVTCGVCREDTEKTSAA